MNKINVLNIIIALIFGLFMGVDSIISLNLNHFAYNPLLVIPLFSLIYFLIVKIEILIFNNALKKIEIYRLLINSITFLLVLILSLIYISRIKISGLGNFGDYIEQGNYLFKLFRVTFLYSIVAFSFTNMILTSFDQGSINFKKLKYGIITSLVLFWFNYALTFLIIPLFDIIFLLIGFSTGG